MKPLDEYLNDQIEQHVLKTGRSRQQASGFTKRESVHERASEIDELVTLALRLRRAPQLQVAPDFASQLERHLRRHHAEQRLRQGSKPSTLWSLLRTHRVLGVVLGLCLCVCLLSTGLLALAAQISDPGNPLYALRRWEQHIQVQFSGNPADQAALELQFARDRLNSLVSLASSAHAGAYRQGLLDLNQQVSAASAAIKGLPAGSVHYRLAGELTSLKMDAIHVLRGLLGHLALPDSLA